MKKYGIVAIISILVVALLFAGGCAKKNEQATPQNGQTTKEGKITLAGSTALLPLAKQAATLYMEKNPKVTVNVSGGGSFTGLRQVIAGAVDIGNSDVDAEKDPETAGKGLVDHQVAVAPFVIIVNPDVKVDNLSKEQLADIFTGKITNWKEVGGNDAKITIIHRAKSSGSRKVITDLVLDGKEFTDKAIIQDSNGAVRKAISQTPGSIGYIDAAYIDNSVKVLKYNGVEYTPENVYNKKYTLYAYEHMYTKGEPTGVVKDFLDFVLSDEFQNNYVEKLGFLSISKMK
ncbi:MULTISPECIES: phosphate ABC transporter substrate-binding protein [Carboxydothermus]|uniref:Phosphate-binding protein n=2 Tax=Carboxydothermus TaxID=129957 RepID=Q3ADZ5_CARHZ|nr:MULTISPECIES: phosphate ABC transporter substrate-binding protein [Carboxydothermus]ABB14119.1 phosphate ABC transporter, phosphate-binding protein [Carboxydothermus hydrogenoformans Z-2901]NYE56660.1 phosphate transport system substrate-binding protein [Carboxydothermus ferrireducens DSM 11255]